MSTASGFEPGVAETVILWGANYYANMLPCLSSWIVWDKRENITRNSFADCELAWSSAGGPARIFYHLWNGLHKGSQHGERRYHPTEKPVALYEELGRLHADGLVWVDFYAGSGSQVVAAHNTGATCYAAEIEPLYGAVIIHRLRKLGVEPKLLTE
jgi:DNA modification methylase